MNQLCKVCGEPAAGFHFGAFTCEGCKSFFGRTYNNLSQIHECKNGGVCIINKQNRTSCKACRLRKCLFVGMSKSGSRYGRRSNWFKIHCLLQEQASFVSQPPNFRTPATPTLQDGSLPFVATQLRDPIGGMDSPLPHNTEVSSTNSPISLSSQSPISRIGVTNISPQLTQAYSTSLLTPDRRLHDGNFQQRNFPMSCEGSYREHLLNLLQRSQGIESLRPPSNPPMSDDGRSSSEMGSHLGPLAFAHWERKIQEASRRIDMENSDSKCSSPKSMTEQSRSDSKVESGRSSKSHEKHDALQRSPSSSPIKDTVQKDLGGISPKSESNENKNEERRDQETLMTDEERLAFLKSASNISSSYRPRPEPIKNTLRFPGTNELMYSPLNNNIFSFPPYPPVWPSIIPFSPFSKLYPPFCPPAVVNPLPFEHAKPSFPQIDRSPDSPPFSSKEDPIKKKRFLDAILQVQKERRSPPDRSPLCSPRPSSRNSPRQHSVVRSVSMTSTDQPMDLTVRRKRKMDKSEIVYKPSDDVDEMDNDVMETDKNEPLEMKLPETTMTATSSELPMKFIKLDSETVTV